MTHYTKEDALSEYNYIMDKLKSIQHAAENMRDGSPVELGYMLEKAGDLYRHLKREAEYFKIGE